MSERKQNSAKTATRSVNVPTEIKPLLEEIGRIADQAKVSAYAVGGCVRDWLLGMNRMTDLDIAVVGDGLAFARRLARALGARMTGHEQFGTATLLLEAARRRHRKALSLPPGRSLHAVRIDIASCRKERYVEPAAYPKVTPGTLTDDLFRRDFTINTMALALAPSEFGQLIDPFNGLRDLAARRLRILHARSFLDDPSRILRAARFVPRFGLTLEAQTRKALHQAIAAKVLVRLNRGRWRKELERMIGEPDPPACFACVGWWLALFKEGKTGNLKPVAR